MTTSPPTIMRDIKTLRADIARGLRDELIDALLTDPAKEVRTPGFAAANTPALAVVAHALGGPNGEATLHEMLRILGLCDRGEQIGPHVRAKALFARLGDDHAEYHVDDAIAKLLEPQP